MGYNGNKPITPWKGSWAHQMEQERESQHLLEESPHAHELINHSDPEK